MIAKRSIYLGAALILAALLLAACQPGAPAATQAPEAAATEDIPETGATTEAPAVTQVVTEAPAATQVVTEAVVTLEAATEAPAVTAAATEAPSGTEAGGAAGSAAGVTCTLTEDAEQQLVSTGENIYTSTCTVCHGPQGEGQGNFPALAGNTDIQTEDPTEMIQVLLNPQVHPFADQLANEEAASVLSYVRSEFGEQAPAICTEQVDAVRPGQ